MKKSYIFICGAPRSGTTALTNVVNSFEATFIGTEVFSNYFQKTDPVTLTPSSFETDKILRTLVDKSGQVRGEDLSRKFSDARVIGDKHPLYHRKFNELSENFPNSTILFIFRDIAAVARSFQRRADNPNDAWSLQDFRAVTYWCDGASDFLKFQKSNPEKCISIYFNSFLGGNPDENISFVEGLHNKISEKHDVGEIQYSDLNSIFSNSVKNREENSWESLAADEKYIFDSYNEKIKNSLWSYDQYVGMKEELLSVSLNK